MPYFEIVSMQEARLKSASGRQQQFLDEYGGYIQQLPQGQAGKLQPTGDEKITTVRNRLNAAATMLGKNLVIRRSGEELYFWEEPPQEEAPRRRGRRRKGGDDAEGEV
jgi:hypothetical protein